MTPRTRGPSRQAGIRARLPKTDLLHPAIMLLRLGRLQESCPVTSLSLASILGNKQALNNLRSFRPSDRPSVQAISGNIYLSSGNKEFGVCRLGLLVSQPSSQLIDASVDGMMLVGTEGGCGYYTLPTGPSEGVYVDPEAYYKLTNRSHLSLAGQSAFKPFKGVPKQIELVSELNDGRVEKRWVVDTSDRRFVQDANGHWMLSGTERLGTPCPFTITSDGLIMTRKTADNEYFEPYTSRYQKSDHFVVHYDNVPDDDDPGDDEATSDRDNCSSANNGTDSKIRRPPPGIRRPEAPTPGSPTSPDLLVFDP
ncbi:hypothetical protein IAU60_000390 [Kwoniella sp. DSM 27419]